MLNNLDSEYKVIIVGDACMAPSELLRVGGASYRISYNPEPGVVWLRRVRQKYPHIIWLNPISKKSWNIVYGNHTLNMIRDIFPMYPLSLEGLDEGIKKLLVNR